MSSFRNFHCQGYLWNPISSVTVSDCWLLIFEFTFVHFCKKKSVLLASFVVFAFPTIIDHERKKVSSNSVMPCYKYADKSNGSDYPDLTSDSGEDSDESDVDSDSDCSCDCEKQTHHMVGHVLNHIYESKKNSKTSNSESKSALHVYDDVDSQESASPLNASSHPQSKTEVSCCKCHSQGAKCTNCRCKKVENIAPIAYHC